MSLSRHAFVTRMMDLIGKEFPVLEGPDLSLGEVKSFRLKLGDVVQQAIQDACQHEKPELGIFGDREFCALCGAVLPPKENQHG